MYRKKVESERFEIRFFDNSCIFSNHIRVTQKSHNILSYNDLYNPYVSYVIQYAPILHKLSKSLKS